MVRRITALGEFFRVSIAALQFVVGIRFMSEMFDSDVTVRRIGEAMNVTLGQMSVVARAAGTGNPSMDGPPILLFCLGFILFGFFLFAIAPGASKGIEKKMSRSLRASALADVFIPD
ncbi:MAG: hypothetical protein WCL23_05925 [Candidatus Moraniibacteriota bacterium]